MSKYRRTIVLAISDTHGGHKLGLLNPDTVLEQVGKDQKIYRYKPDLQEIQVFLWEHLENSIKEIRSLAGKDDIAVIHLGDPTQGNIFPREQISTRMADQIIIARDNMLPLLDVPNVKIVRFAVGTGSHEFGEGSSTILLQELLKEKYPRKNIQFVYHAKDNIQGIAVDYAHHGPPPGSRYWLKGNQARLYLQSAMDYEFSMGFDPADLYLRGHYHVPIKEIVFKHYRGKEYKSMIVVMPGFCGLGDYGMQATRSAFILSIGVMAFEIINGKIYESYQFVESIDLRSSEELL